MRLTIHAWDLMANGVEIEPVMSEEETLEDDTFYQIYDYDLPLPEGVRNQDVLELSMPLRQNVAYYWFDGSRWYGREAWNVEVGTLTATVKRDAESQIKRFTGTGEYKGVTVTITADISLAFGEVTITAKKDAFGLIRTDVGLMSPWEMVLVDDQGRRFYESSSGQPITPREMHFTCSGTGFIPESLTMLLYEYDWDNDSCTEEEAKAQGVTFTLTAE